VVLAKAYMWMNESATRLRILVIAIGEGLAGKKPCQQVFEYMIRDSVCSMLHLELRVHPLQAMKYWWPLDVTC
jgi:hypothetical protein